MNLPREPPPPTLEELRTIPVLEDLPEGQLRWILEHSEVMEYEDGAVMYRTGDPIDHLWLLIDGLVHFYLDVNGRLVHYFTFDREPPARGAGGLLPYSRMKTSPGWTYARGRVRGVRLHRSQLRELEGVSPELVQRLIAGMTERARVFATRKLQEEKISALGKLAAGLAHELNNPAAAIQRTAEELSRRLERSWELTAALLDGSLSGADLRKVRAALESDRSRRSPGGGGLRERMRREEELEERLEALGMKDAAPLAEALADAGVDGAALEAISGGLAETDFGPAVEWIANLLTSSRVIGEVEEASVRISTLVTAIKGHVHLDRSAAVEPVDLGRGIEDTLTLLDHKLRAKDVRVSRSYPDSLPAVLGFTGELNQVWTNLIDNAIDAVEPGGHLRIGVAEDRDRVRIEIEDDGPGIPEDLQGQIFDPFFTTKKQGQGTGMGLDIVSQIVVRNQGEIRFTSEPGRTRFLVSLPLAPLGEASAGNEAENPERAEP